MLPPLLWVYGSYCNSFCPSPPARRPGSLSLLAGALRMELSLPRTSYFHGQAPSPSSDTQESPSISSVTSRSTRVANPAFREGEAAGEVGQHRALATVNHTTLSCSSFSALPPPGSPVTTVMSTSRALLGTPCVYPVRATTKLLSNSLSRGLCCPSPVRLWAPVCPARYQTTELT